MKDSLFLTLIGACLSLVILTLYLILGARPSLVELIFCDVGQGDATLIQKGNFQILIDAGPDQSVVECLQANMPPFDTFVDIAILTHPDLDHFGGFESLFSDFKVRLLVFTQAEKQTDAFQRFKQRALSEVVQVMIWQDSGCLYLFENGQLCNIWYQGEYPLCKGQMYPHDETLLLDSKCVKYVCDSDCNDLSLVLLFKYNKVDLLLSADAGVQAIQAILIQKLIGGVEVLKVPHHGAKLALFDDLLERTAPEIAIISAGRKNRYGHPHPSITSSLERSKIALYRTDLQGTVTLRTNGLVIWPTN